MQQTRNGPGFKFHLIRAYTAILFSDILRISGVLIFRTQIQNPKQSRVLSSWLKRSHLMGLGSIFYFSSNLNSPKVSCFINIFISKILCCIAQLELAGSCNYSNFAEYCVHLIFNGRDTRSISEKA